MAITVGARYFAQRVGTNASNGHPVYALRDPCATTGKMIAKRVGANDSNGRPVYAAKDCSTATAQAGSKYLAQRVGANASNGRPVFALRCQTCICNSGLRVTGCFGQALPGAVVKVYDGEDNLVAEATTNASGAVTFEIPAAGDYRVVIEAKRYVTSDQVRTLACTTPGPMIALVQKEGYVCVGCCGYMPQPQQWGIEMEGFGIFYVDLQPDVPCDWTGVAAGEVPGSPTMHSTYTERASPTSINSCIGGGGGGELGVLGNRIYCCGDLPPGEMCGKTSDPQAYHYIATGSTPARRYTAFVLIEDYATIPVNAPFRLQIASPGSGSMSLQVSTKALRVDVLGARYPDAGGCRPQLYNQPAWIDPSAPSYTLGTGVEMKIAGSIRYSDDCDASGTVELAVPEVPFDIFAVKTGTPTEICYGDEFTIPVPMFATWPYGAEEIRIFDPIALPPPGPMMMMQSAPDPGSSPAAPAIRTRPLAEALELRLLIQECPHLVPKQPGDGCGCIGRCSVGRGDMHDARTSYRNCEGCQAGELGAEG